MRTRQRNLVLERLAYLLPYILFILAMLLLDSIGRAATQEEFFKSVQDGLNNTGPGGSGQISLRSFGMFLGVAGLIIAALVLASKLQKRLALAGPRKVARPSAVNQPRKLIKEIARSAGLSGDEMRQLKALAEQHEYASPLTLLVCPSLLIDAARNEGTRADKQVLARVARKLVER
ncbi:MAG: hypothetical protein WBD40_11800 [Tepidisphaeraceae bacterium]